jgi:hypothetical protein
MPLLLLLPRRSLHTFFDDAASRGCRSLSRSGRRTRGRTNAVTRPGGQCVSRCIMWSFLRSMSLAQAIAMASAHRPILGRCVIHTYALTLSCEPSLSLSCARAGRTRAPAAPLSLRSAAGD